MSKPRLILITVVSLLGTYPALAQTDLLSLSSPPAFGPLVGSSFSTLVGSQTVSGYVYNGGVSLGDNVYGDFVSSPQNWSLEITGGNVFSLFMSVSGTNPDIPFSIEFFESGGSQDTIAIWEGTTVGLTSTPTYNSLSLLSTATGDYSSVGSFIFTWNPGSTESINSTISTVAVVPEPSTYALLALSGLAFGGYVIRRRRRA
jgi:hypothetical protein